MQRVAFYGDSLLKGTVPDKSGRYAFRWDEFLDSEASQAVINRARFGATVEKGLTMLRHDLQRGLEAEMALIDFGGNDSDYDWAAIAADPAAEHQPRTPLTQYLSALEELTEELLHAGIRPILMNLPPIDAQRYFECICGRVPKHENILRWLGSVDVIYRYQEMYSNAMTGFAREKNLPLIDVRRIFLPRHDLPELIAADGIHLSRAGYGLLFGAIREGVWQS